RATATNGLSATTNITVTVTANPSLQFTRWKDPVDGNWSDATKWTTGVPAATNDAIIDAIGSYTVTLDVDTTVGNLVVGAISGSPTLSLPGHSLSISGQGQVRSNGVFNLTSGALTGNGSLLVHGRLGWTGGTMSGSGVTVI